MKKIIILSLSLVFSISIYGQNLLTLTYENWSGGAWVNYSEQTNTYDGSGYLTNQLVQLWDGSSSSWKNSSQTNYTNNVNGTIQQLIQQSWLTTGAWSNSLRTIYTYNGSNQVLTLTYENWSGGAWVNYLKSTNSYDASGYLTNNVVQLWDGSSSSWKNSSQTNYTNNVNGTIQQFIQQSWLTTGAWSNSQRATMTYTNPTGINESNEIPFHFFPNPTSGILNSVLTSLSEYEVFNINGQRVAQGKTEGQIDMINLPTGSYQIIITNEDGRSTHTIQKI